MPVTLNFENFNPGIEGIAIYRSDDPIDANNLPEPLVTLGPTETTYTDDTTVHGQMYHYRVAVYIGTDVAPGPNYAMRDATASETGPGPQNIVSGDWNLGLFGQLRSSDFMPTANVASHLGITAGTAAPDFNWIKVAYKGKVLFIPISVTRFNLSYNSVYSAGGIYGTDDDGLVTPAGALATNQFKPMIFNGYTLIPRVLKGCPMGVPAPPNRDGRVTPVTALPDNEFDDILGMMLPINPPNTLIVDKGKFGRYEEYLWPISTGAAIAYMEMTPQPTGDILTVFPGRGGRLYNANIAMAGSNLSLNVATASMTTTFYVSSGSVQSAWRGILELVI